MKLLIQLVRKILHLSGKSRGISETSGAGFRAKGGILKTRIHESGEKSRGLLSPLPSRARLGRNEMFLKHNRASKIRKLA